MPIKLYWEELKPCFICNTNKDLCITARSIMQYMGGEPINVEDFTICETCVENLNYRMKLWNDNQWRKQNDNHKI